jgi:hypothetical protein
MKNKKLILTSLAILIYTAVFGLCGVVQAANIYVNHTGSNTLSYDTEAKASTDIQVALDAAASGDTVWIKADQDYVMNVTDQQAAAFDVDANDNVTIKGYYLTPGDQDAGGAYYKDATHGWAVIDANNGNYHVFNTGTVAATKKNLQWHNLKIINTNPNTNTVPEPDENYFCFNLSDYWPGGISGNDEYLVQNCWTTGGGKAITTDYLNNITIRDCKFTGDYHQSYSILRLHRVRGLSTVEDCYFAFGNTGEGICTSYGATKYGALNVRNCIFNLTTDDRLTNMIILTNTSGGTIANNTLYVGPDATNVQYGIHIYSTASNYQIYNNIIVGTKYQSIFNQGTNTVGGYNCFYNNGTNWTLRDGDIVADPLFTNAASADFSLQSTSPCIDAGDPNSDWSAEPWPNGKRINMGAYGGTEQASKSGNIADLNIDGIVNFLDLAELGKMWGQTQNAIEDLDNSGTVDIGDLDILVTNWLWEKPSGNIADLNIDGKVNFLDLAELGKMWGQTQNAIEDLDNSGTVDIGDLEIVAANWLWEKQQ